MLSVSKKLTKSILILASVFVCGFAQARPGQYSVPVDESELKSDATFAMELLNVEFKSDGSMKLEYHLPLELSGPNPKHFILNGPAPKVGEPSDISGANAGGRCEVLNLRRGRFADLSCHMGYGELELDPQAAFEYVESLNLEPIRSQNIGRVIEIFAFKPIGIITTRVRIRY